MPRQSLPELGSFERRFGSRLLTVRDVADLLQLHDETIRIQARDGRIPAIKVGLQWRFEPAALDMYLASMNEKAS